MMSKWTKERMTKSTTTLLLKAARSSSGINMIKRRTIARTNKLDVAANRITVINTTTTVNAPRKAHLVAKVPFSNPIRVLVENGTRPTTRL